MASIASHKDGVDFFGGVGHNMAVGAVQA